MADTTTEPALKIPFDGEFRPAPTKKFLETIVLVPFYGARKSSLRRHIEFLNDLGYDVVVFDLKKDPRGLGTSILSNSLVSSQQTLGMKHIWTDQIEAVLNSLPGQKILYAFSNPSASAIEAVARRHASDITGLICDSGPSGNLYHSLINYFTYEEPVRFLPMRMALAFGLTVGWSPHFSSSVHDDIEKLPKHFKILSIRGWKDKIISAEDIDKIFEPHLNIDWQRLSLPQADHVTGLRDFKEDYEGPVEEFLKPISTAV